ncbi:MAG: AMP-binding protein [Proteobacteria bacterium]|nr:AMP-binding protein [Desulfobacterales bacterium]MBL7102154.1 AMP-binding protein [Desulfobacteraceae bacterium]MBL7173052.1 AMP-binding protein [Desulfobacteraceae bacterium]MBU0734618.1 AMP-binding protein [Pseudomonadota bacterium]MBU1901986.1 AMP-binding protein [Pseudomonadota bacterium]
MNSSKSQSGEVPRTLPSLLVRNAERFGNSRVALREKEYGIWQPVTWREYLEHVRDFSLGLTSLGFGRGDTLGIIGNNRPEWLYAELGTEAAGGVPFGIFQDSILSEVAYIIDHSEAVILVAEDQEQVDKILDLKEKLPRIKKIIYTDPKGLWDYEDDILIDYYEVERLGREIHEKDPDLFLKNVNSINEGDLATICYTSGTTGNPKGTLLTYSNIISMVASLNEVDPKFPDDQFLSFIPLPWIVEQTMSVFSALYSGYTVNFPEEPETAMADLYEIAPSLVVASPRMWEGMSRQVMVKHLDASFLKGLVYDLCLPVGYRWADFKFDKKKPSLGWKTLYWIAYFSMFRALRDRLGFSKVRSAMTGGAALGPDVFRFFHALGINLKQIYGQTEVAGYSTIHRDGDINFDSVGIPVPSAEISIFEPDGEGVGEVISTGPGLFQGYLKNEEASRETIIDGWLHSGDAGYFTPDGHLVIIDRVKDLMHLKSGARFSPMFIENKLKFCPYIVETVVLGHQQEYVAAMICIDYKHAGKWAEDHRISYTTYSDLAAKPEIYDLIEREVVRVNKTLPEKARIKKFLLLYKELDPDDEELTRTKKIRRGFINEKYVKEIAALYSDVSEIPIEAVIRYQDGKTATLRTHLIIRTMKPESEYKDSLRKKGFWGRLRGRS